MADDKEEETSDFCSSEDEEDDDGDGNEEYDEEEDEDDGLEGTDDEGMSLSGDDSEWSEDDLTESDMDEDDEDDDDDDDDDGDCGDDEDSLVNKVVQLLKDGRDLKVLKVSQCKAYLRKHGLRLAGTKADCIERIVEHWRIKDGNGEVVYPRPSFVINCRGDVCKGDTLLFTQKVYQKFEKMKRSGKLLGTRTVAGKVVKESYGRAKQQHTFTIEVLWSKGSQKLPPLHPLLVKGRNLYRLRTFRQPWANEDDRLKALSEKHKRGAAARKVRDMRKDRKMKSHFIERGKRQSRCRETQPYQGRSRKVEKGMFANGRENPSQCFRQEIRGGHAFAKPNPNPSRGRKNPTERRNLDKSSRPFTSHPYVPCPSVPTTYVPHSYVSHDPHSNVPITYSYTYQTQYPSLSQNQSCPPVYDGSSTSSAIIPVSFGPCASTRSGIPVSYQSRSHRNRHSRRSNSNPSRHYGARYLNRFSETMTNYIPEGEIYRQSNDNLRTKRWS